MLSRLDDIIFPNRCEVLEIVPSQRYIYPIFKNGSGSITEYAKLQKYKILFNEQIKRVNQVDVILRDPQDRFISGVNTYIFNLLKENKTLDKSTILYFVENYLFLNRHYSPQLGWLFNLSKYLNKDAKLNLLGMENLWEFTPMNIKPFEDMLLTSAEVERLKNNEYNQQYLILDNLLLGLVGQQLTFDEILTYIKDNDPNHVLH